MPPSCLLTSRTSLNRSPVLQRKLGRFLIQLVEGRLEKVEIIYGGELSQSTYNTKFITRVALKGLLDPILQVPVNIVNAEYIASERGISVKRDNYRRRTRV